MKKETFLALAGSCFGKVQWLQLIFINTLIAVLLTLVSQNGFWENLIYSQFIGISIATSVTLVAYRNPNKHSNILYIALSIILGVIIGFTLATLVTGNYKMVDMPQGREIAYSSFFYSLIIGCIVVYYFSLINKQQRIANQLNIEKLKHAEYQKALTENNLKLLQAQIEPHFLFNTLSNVLGLIDSRPADAKQMLEHFTHYLRSTLSRTRGKDTCLKDEIDIVNAYLAIQKIRMGKRLQYKIDVSKDVEDIPFPPLLIQPLVENSIRHGLESEIDGGEIRVNAFSKDKFLTIIVCDTGKGANKLSSNGIGLQNVNERLSSVFHQKAEIKIKDNQPKGLIVTLNIPLEKQ